MTAAQAREISLQQLAAAGGLKDAINKDAEDVFGRFPEEQTAMASLFQRITEKGEGEKPIRKPETLTVLAKITGLDASRLRVIVDGFVGRDLLVLRQVENGEIQVDLPHECLGWKWERFQRWIDEEAALAKSLEFLKESAKKGQRLNGSVLWEAHVLRKQGRLDGPWARRYLAETELAGVAQWVVKSEQAAKGTTILVCLVVAILAGLSLWVWNQKKLADRFADQAGKSADAAVAQARRAVYAESVVKGEIEFDAGRPDQAAAYFARALRSAPDSLTATSWISNLRLDRDQRLTSAPLQHQDIVNSAEFSPDGRRVVTASYDRTARVWEADTGRPVGAPLQHRIPVGQLLQDHSWVYSAKFSPDGRRVVTASEDKTARVWEADTGKPAGAPLEHQRAVNSAAFSPDGRRVVTASSDGTARVWEADTGKPVGAPLQHQDIVNSAEFSPDGRRVVTASYDRTARVWEADTGRPVGAPLQHRIPVGQLLQDHSWVYSAKFSPDGRRVVTASEDKTARVWEADTGKPVGAPLQHRDTVYSAAFSPNGRRVVTASGDHTARVWEADTGKPVGAPMQHQDDVNSAAFSPDGRRVVTASDDKTARVWEADTGKPVGAPLQHQDRVSYAAFSLDGRRVVTASHDKTARVWVVLLQCCASQLEADRLASLAEAVSGYEVNAIGSLTAIDGKERLQKLIRESGTGPAPELSVDWLIRRLGSEPRPLKER